MDTLSLTKEARIYNGLKTISNKWCWENWSSTCKRMKLEHFLTPSVQFNSVAQSCPTLCNPIDCSPPAFRPWDSPGKNTGLGCHFLLQCMKVKMKGKSLCRVRLLATPWTAAHQAPPSTWDLPGKSTGVSCHCLLRDLSINAS